MFWQSKESKDIKIFNQRMTDISKKFENSSSIISQYISVAKSLGLEMNENGVVRNTAKNRALIDEGELSNLLKELPTVGSIKKEFKKENIISKKAIEKELKKKDDIYKWLDKYKNTFAYQLAKDMGAFEEGVNIRDLTTEEINKLIKTEKKATRQYSKNPFVEIDIEKVKERKKEKRSQYGKISRVRKKKQQEKLKKRGFKYK